MDAAAHAQHAQHPAQPSQAAVGSPAKDANASIVLQLAELSARIGQIEAKVPQAVPPAQPAVDAATHAAHVAAGAVSPPAASGTKRNLALEQKLSGLQAKLAQLEAALAKNAQHPAAAAAPAMAPMTGMAAPAVSPAPMAQSPSAPSPAAESMAGMSATKPGGSGMNMMGMMDKMMGMMDKMMPMGASQSSGGPGMSMAGGAMQAGAKTPAASGGAMGMDKMEMAGMMGLGAMSGGTGAAMPKSVLPGFPGASHLYHIGATDFFLDHPQHIALSIEQTAALNKMKERALLAKITSERVIKQAEQELWSLTASDQPDAAKIEAAIHEIGTLTGAARLAFIRAIGEASSVLTDEQRKALTGFAPPAPAMPAAAMAPMNNG
ncbi:MAG: periplasmic heavy metal sensor [Planctomycetota bacterium]